MSSHPYKRQYQWKASLMNDQDELLLQLEQLDGEDLEPAFTQNGPYSDHYSNSDTTLLHSLPGRSWALLLKAGTC